MVACHLNIYKLSMACPLIAIAGLACETSTFTPSRTSAAAFHPQRGGTILTERYPFLLPGTPLGDAAAWHGALTGHALPGGQVTRKAFESLASEIITRLRQIVAAHGPLDGLWFDIHGAMVVEGVSDAEAELLRRIRAVIGPSALSRTGACSRPADVLPRRTAPHVDVRTTRERACRNLVACLRRGQRPLKAWVPVPILLPGEQTSTRDEPASSIYAAVTVVEASDGVLDAAVWVGYAWADEPRNRAAIVVTGWERGAVARGAELLARLFWDARAEFRFVAPTGSFAECLDAALRADAARRPFFISDSGDNPTAGGSGDVTWGLTRLLEREEFRAPTGPTVIYASVPGPEAVEVAVRAGVGATVTVTAGAEVDDLHAGPITLTGRVHSIKEGDVHAGVEVVLQVGSVLAILTKLRKPYHLERDFTQLDLRPRDADVVIVKIGYLEPELYAMAKDWMLGLTPGGVDQDLERLGHQKIHRPMWPFDRVFNKDPDLSARFIPMSDEPLTGVDE
ncbi:hypothetical protein GGX14DRAFT_482363 [Mycena pura]|uniref:Microcystin LR degradation protein MlrC C-terminal domain-containing protein n=1 Tax=Mycena pura TaxID=153505 RepID=A0AAD6URT8_9AGAR|nr:hypothetical protein GGX14DRAFT_482363 [Mycena pura]